MTPFAKDDCPICGSKPGLAHDQAAHDRRKAEDWPPTPKLQRDLTDPTHYSPPGDPQLPPYVRSLIEKKPELRDQIIAEYQAGLAGERATADDSVVDAQRSLAPIKKPLELQPPRKVFGYGDDE